MMSQSGPSRSVPHEIEISGSMLAGVKLPKPILSRKRACLCFGSPRFGQSGHHRSLDVELGWGVGSGS